MFCCCESRHIDERREANYYAIIIDATLDSAHKEQETFILRYVRFRVEDNCYDICERFLTFVECSLKKKGGVDIADMVLDTLAEHNIPIGYCRGQGHDNGANMSGRFNGVQAKLLGVCSLAVFFTMWMPYPKPVWK